MLNKWRSRNLYTPYTLNYINSQLSNRRVYVITTTLTVHDINKAPSHHRDTSIDFTKILSPRILVEVSIVKHDTSKSLPPRTLGVLFEGRGVVN